MATGLLESMDYKGGSQHTTLLRAAASLLKCVHTKQLTSTSQQLYLAYFDRKMAELIAL